MTEVQAGIIKRKTEADLLPLKVASIVSIDRLQVCALMASCWSCRAVQSRRLVPGDVIAVLQGRATCDMVLLRGSCLVEESMLSGEVAFLAVIALFLHRGLLSQMYRLRRFGALLEGAFRPLQAQREPCMLQETSACFKRGHALALIIIPEINFVSSALTLCCSSLVSSSSS